MPATSKMVSIGKLEAARRQLDAALLLYFDDGDAVAVHALTAGAHEVLRDLSKKMGKHMLVEGSLLQSIGPEFTAELVSLMRKQQNFLKHADRDPESTLEFSPRLTDLLLLDCAAKYLDIKGEQTLWQRAFEKWFVVHYPQFWRKTELRSLAEKSSSLFGQMNRRTFLRQFFDTAAGLSPRPRVSSE